MEIIFTFLVFDRRNKKSVVHHRNNIQINSQLLNTLNASLVVNNFQNEYSKCLTCDINHYVY